MRLKFIHCFLIIGLFFSSCSHSSKNSDTTLKSDSDSISESLLIDSDSISEQATTLSDNENDCIFDLSTQTDEFIKGIPEFSNYVWNDSTKTGIIILENGDSLIVKRGGCNHFGISGQWIQQNKNHTIEEVDYWLEQGKWISKRIFTNADYSRLEKLIEEENYEMNFYDNRLYILFNDDNYSEWYLSVDWDFEMDKNNVIVETGYYFN